MITVTRTSRASLTRAALFLVASFGLTACAADGLSAPDHVSAATVVLTSSTSATLASIGDSAMLRTRVLDQNGHTLDGTRLRWTVMPAGIVQRDGEGVYRAIGNGRATVIAELDPGETGVRPSGYWAARVADSVVIEVKQIPARLVLAPVDTAFATLGAIRQVHALVSDARGNPMLDAVPALIWGSDDSHILAVDTAGKVRSLGEGAARITAQVGELRGATTFTVHPRLAHTSCMVFEQRNQSKESCVTIELVMRAREGGQ
jgi:hypothetical protein